ncbi:autotransporter family protein [Oceanisphaera ostreae]|uniref:Autotransporter domain-containing protein n=1 Tax=Oceanisphaera ostreae TaxID=914151 RepID=A0ABW3KJK7_9GAMM
MTFNKSQLAMAVAMAISFSAQAQTTTNYGSLTLDGYASVGSASADTDTDTRKFEDETSPINEVFEKAPSGPIAVYQSNNESLLEIRNADLNQMDMDLQDIDSSREEFLTTGSESTFIFDNVTSRATIIETNGSHIEHNGSAAAIEISNSKLAGVEFEVLPNDKPIPDIFLDQKELLTNNGGEIVVDEFYDDVSKTYLTGGNAIDISDSNIDGVIINEDWSGTEAPMTGGFIASTGDAAISVRDAEWRGGVINSSRNAVSEISGGTNGIELIDTKFVGAIINEALGNDPENRPVIVGDKRAILVSGGSFKGNIDNSGLLQVGHGSGYYQEDVTGEAAIVLSETRFEGNIVNTGEISNENEFGYNSGKVAILVERSQVLGNIINDGLIKGAIVVDGSKHNWTDTDENGQSAWTNTAGHGSMKGNIVNTGNIQAEYTSSAIDIEGADFEGNIVNESSINSMGKGVSITGNFVGAGTTKHNREDDNFHHESASTMGIGIATGNIINTQHASINSNGDSLLLDSINFTGNIKNAGSINSNYGSGIAIHGGHEQSTISLDKSELPEQGSVHGESSTHRSIVSKIVGNILNTETGHINSISSDSYTGDSTAIYLNSVDMKGDILNHGKITASGSGIELTGEKNYVQKAIWENLLDGYLGTYKGEWETQKSTLKGNIVNSGNIKAGEHAVIINEGAELDGNIINKGNIQGVKSGITLTGGYKESGAYTILDTWEGPNIREEDRSQLEVIKRPSIFNGSIVNEAESSILSQGAGIDLSNLTANASITNHGTISGTETGIYIADDVTGNLTINQLAGELNGATALRMNKVTRTNYTGGSIKGNVDNHGGTFYVEGDQSIVGDYMQTAGSTLAMGLHTKTSLTADNINLAEGSKVLIDLTKGNLYVQNGEQVELLKVNAGGTLTDTDVKYVVSSSLVTVANAERNDAGNLVLTFDRSSFIEQAQKHENDGKLSGQQAKNVTVLAAALQKLDKLAQNNPDVAKLLNSLDGSPESFSALLPDVSGASVAGAMNASNQSSSQISVRARGLASGDTLDNSGLWMQGLVSKGQQDNRDGNAYDVNSHGFVLGADTELNNGLVVGGAYSFIASESKTANSNTDSDYHMATAYAAQSMGQILLDGQVYYAWGDNDGSRNIGTTSSYDSSLYGARVGAGYQFDIAPGTRLVPTLSVDASRLSVDGYTETGLAGLKVDSQNFNRFEMGLSTELSKDYQLSRAMVTPSVNLGVFHDFEAEAQNSTVAFAAAPSETFNVSGTKPEKNRYVAGVGLDIMSGENLTVSAEYNYNWNGDGFDANSGALKFRWDF